MFITGSYSPEQALDSLVSSVTPAAGFPATAQHQVAALIEVNPYETPLSRKCPYYHLAPAGEALPRVVEHIKELKAEKGS